MHAGPIVRVPVGPSLALAMRMFCARIAYAFVASAVPLWLAGCSAVVADTSDAGIANATDPGCTPSACTDPMGCSPIVLAANQNFPSRIALSGTWAYFTGFYGGTVMRVSLCGGPPSVVALGERDPGPIAVDGTRAYFVTGVDNALRAVPLSGGTAITLVENPKVDVLTDIALDAEFAYFTTAALDSSLRKVSLLGGAPLLVAPDSDGPVLIDGDQLYFGSRGQLARVAKQGGAVTGVGDFLGEVVRAIVADDENVYFTATVGAPPPTRNDWAVLRVAKAGGASVFLATSEAPITGLGQDGENLYWTNEDGAIRMTAKVGGDVRTKWSDGTVGTAIAVTSTSIVFAEGTTSDGRVMRLPK